MTNTKYQSIAEVRIERARLLTKKQRLEREIKEDFEDLKESFKPVNLVKDFFKSDNHAQNGQAISPVASNLVSTILDLVISKVLFNKNSYIKKFLSSYLIHTTGPSVIQKFGPTIFNSLKAFIGEFLHKKKSGPIYEQSTASTWHGE